MNEISNSGRLDWLVELVGAAVPAAAVAFAAYKLAPGWLLGAAAAALVVAFWAMRGIQPEPRTYALPEFDILPLPDPRLHREEPVIDELILDEVHAEHADELLLEDVLPEPPADARVVQLFAVEPMPTAGQLKARIDRHLAGIPRPALYEIPDASDALFAALADLRRSLR